MQFDNESQTMGVQEGSSVWEILEGGGYSWCASCSSVGPVLKLIEMGRVEKSVAFVSRANDTPSLHCVSVYSTVLNPPNSEHLCYLYMLKHKINKEIKARLYSHTQNQLTLLLERSS